MPLSKDELKRRIHAARILRAITQADLNDALAAEGLDKQEAGRIERGALDLTRIRREALARALGVPVRWFTAETVDEIVNPTEPTDDDDHDGTPSVEDMLATALHQLSVIQELLPRTGRDIGLRDLQRRLDGDRPAESAEAEAQGFGA